MMTEDMPGVSTEKNRDNLIDEQIRSFLRKSIELYRNQIITDIDKRGLHTSFTPQDKKTLRLFLKTSLHNCIRLQLEQDRYSEVRDEHLRQIINGCYEIFPPQLNFKRRVCFLS
jgi:hypothetical protein